jgi:6-phospho-beta-glucosidase
VEDADYVFCAIRVGQLEGRVVDEDVPLGLGVLGQETTGPGGICFALRTIPVMVRLAETIAQHAPRAWLINFTNPAGMVTEASQQVLGDRVVGICDSPSGMCRRVAAAIGREPEELWFDYFGLNHLGWLKGVRDGTGTLLDGLLEDDAALAGFEEGGCSGRVAALARDDPERVPLLLLLRGRHRERDPRQALARRLPAQQHAPSMPPTATTRCGLARDASRSGAHVHGEARSAAGDAHDHEMDANGGYENEAMAVLEAIALNTRAVLILNTPTAPRCRSWTSARSSRSVRRRARRSCADGDGPGPRAHPRAGRDDEGRGAHDDRRGAARLARAGG